MSIYIKIFKGGAVQPGGVLEGKVICVMNTRKKIRGIRLQVIGQEHTSWEKTESYYDVRSKQAKMKRVNYYGDNTVLALQEILHGAGLIERGIHEFPFKFILPNNIPSTYNGTHGNIRYYLKANVDIPMALDFVDEKRFVVDAPIDFNKIRCLLQLNPTQYQDETTLCCCWCASDPITLEVYLEKEAFVVGEVIKMKVHMLNMSSTSLDSLRIGLFREVTEKCTSPSSDVKEETSIVAYYVDAGVVAHGDRDYSPELRIPSGLKLPNLIFSGLFSQRFEIKVEAVIPGFHINLKVTIPVKIGHIPVSKQPIRTVAPTAVSQSHPPRKHASPSSTESIPSATKNLPPPPRGIKSSKLPGVHAMPTPGAPSLQTSSSAPYSVANAPRDETAPSAPSKDDLAEKNDLISFADADGKKRPPPSYHEAMTKK